MNAREHVLIHPHDFPRPPDVKPNTCFVLMPFAEEFTIVYQTVKDALEGIMECHRADDPVRSPVILESVLDGINSSELIIADLTGQNPNVLYEVGLAHTRTKNVLLLTKSLVDVPSDLGAFYCHLYNANSKESLEALKKTVRQKAREILAQRLPTIVKGQEDRTKRIVHYMEQLQDDTERVKQLTIRQQSGLSSLANVGYPDARDRARRELGKWLERERQLLIGLLQRGARLKLMLSLPWPARPMSTTGERRLKRLFEFLNSRDDCVGRCECVISDVGGESLLFFGEHVLFEGHRTAMVRGFAWTVVYTSLSYLKNRIAIFDDRFEAAQEYTRDTYGSLGSTFQQAVLNALTQLRT